MSTITTHHSSLPIIKQSTHILHTTPGLLLADEPTGNLDAATGAAIIDLMFAINAEQGTTLVLVTHDEAIARRCSRVLKLKSGELAT